MDFVDADFEELQRQTGQEESLRVWRILTCYQEEEVNTGTYSEEIFSDGTRNVIE